MSGKEKKTSKKESTNSELQQELQQGLMEIKAQMDKFPAMLEKIGSGLQKQIDSIVSHLIDFKKNFYALQERVETIELPTTSPKISVTMVKRFSAEFEGMYPSTAPIVIDEIAQW